MKRKTIIAIIAILFMAGIFMCLVNQYRPTYEQFLEQNLEALSQNEAPSIQLECSTTSPIIYCSALCLSCKTLWSVPGISGQYVDGSSTCLCGATL